MPYRGEGSEDIAYRNIPALELQDPDKLISVKNSKSDSIMMIGVFYFQNTCIFLFLANSYKFKLKENQHILIE